MEPKSAAPLPQAVGQLLEAEPKLEQVRQQLREDLLKARWIRRPQTSVNPLSLR